jgi:hypothetical protein
MSDGYITSKQLSGNEGLTGVAAREAEEEERAWDDAVLEMAVEILKKEKEKKESNIKKEKKEKKTVANS